MKSKLKKIVPATLLLLAISPIFGQGSLKVISISGWPDTAHCYSLVSGINITLKNTDSNFLSMGQFSILLKNADSNLSHVDTLISNFSDSLSPMQTRAYQVTNYSFTPAAYNAGHDVVIVWPISNSAAHVDSLRDSTYFVCTAGILDNRNEKPFNIFPNPAKEVLYFQFNDAKTALKEVRIFDIIGQEINRYHPTQNSVPINTLSHGFYSIEFLLKDGTILREKFVKE